MAQSSIITSRQLSTWIITASAGALLAFATALQAQVPLPTVTYLPTDPGTGPTDRNVPFLAWHEDLSRVGYVEKEYQLAGLANRYQYIDNATQSPAVQVAQAGQPYTTRLLVRRPATRAKFNGVVYLEILNATARYDGAPMWNLTYPSMIADGAAWVGLTYSDGTAAFLRDTWGTENFPAPPGAQPRDNSRYANLNITTRAHTWDMLNQAAALLREKGSASNPLGNWKVDVIIVTGYSQSAAYVTTFANSFYPSYSATDPASPCNTNESPETSGCTPLVNGFVVGGGGPNARLLDGAGSHPLGDARNLARGLGKTVRFTTESELNAIAARYAPAPEPANYRTYEVAGTAHIDYWRYMLGNKIDEYQFGITDDGAFACDLPLNRIRTGIPLSAIQHRLARWIKYGESPPPSAFMDFEGSLADGTAAWVRDADGNVTGGVRPPRIDVPVGTYMGSNPYSGPPLTTAAFYCASIIGSFAPFDDAELLSRYTNRRTYVVLTWWNIWLSYLDGFLLAVDAKTILDEAKAFDRLP